jgi:hypothetical protein
MLLKLHGKLLELKSWNIWITAYVHIKNS